MSQFIRTACRAPPTCILTCPPRGCIYGARSLTRPVNELVDSSIRNTVNAAGQRQLGIRLYE